MRERRNTIGYDTTGLASRRPPIPIPLLASDVSMSEEDEEKEEQERVEREKEIEKERETEREREGDSEGTKKADTTVVGGEDDEDGQATHRQNTTLSISSQFTPLFASWAGRKRSKSGTFERYVIDIHRIVYEIY